MHGDRARDLGCYRRDRPALSAGSSPLNPEVRGAHAGATAAGVQMLIVSHEEWLVEVSLALRGSFPTATLWLPC